MTGYVYANTKKQAEKIIRSYLPKDRVLVSIKKTRKKGVMYYYTRKRKGDR